MIFFWKLKRDVFAWIHEFFNHTSAFFCLKIKLNFRIYVKFLRIYMIKYYFIRLDTNRPNQLHFFYFVYLFIDWIWFEDVTKYDVTAILGYIIVNFACNGIFSKKKAGKWNAFKNVENSPSKFVCKKISLPLLSCLPSIGTSSKAHSRCSF